MASRRFIPLSSIFPLFPSPDLPSTSEAQYPLCAAKLSTPIVTHAHRTPHSPEPPFRPSSNHTLSPCTILSLSPPLPLFLPVSLANPTVIPGDGEVAPLTPPKDAFFAKRDHPSGSCPMNPISLVAEDEMDPWLTLPDFPPSRTLGILPGCGFCRRSILLRRNLSRLLPIFVEI